MRPLKLTMSAFGPYAATTEIDFDALGTTGVYLVGYALIRFGLEALRGDPRAAIGPFSIGQAISLALLLAGAAFAAAAFRRPAAAN